ncbi:MAG: lysylphosphatidylglycerol synthase domain-containing protein, partial [Planctomycetaceae bacterium]
YPLGWVPSAWYWRRLMRAMGTDVGPLDAARAYFCGHLGKYVPGKAVVLVIRAGMTKARGGSAAVAAVTASFETLLMMGAGLALGLALFPVTGWPPVVVEYVPQAGAMPGLVVLALVLFLPAISLLLRKFATLMTPRDVSGEKRPAEIDSRLVAVGLIVFCASWALLGLSLGLTIRAASPDSFDLRDWPMWTGAVALATSVGFLAVFAPGGLGVREGLLIEILRQQPGVSEREAVIAAVMLRIVWFVAELAAAGGLYSLKRPVADESPNGRSKPNDDDA